MIKNLKGQGINNKFLIGAVPDIYLKEGFEYFCTDIENLISSLYDNSIKAIIAHELAHISNGHNDMKYYNPDLFQDNFSLQHLLEYDADTTALRWILFEDFMNGLNGPFDTKLNIKMDDLVESLKLKVVSYYLALRWNYIEDNKSWNEDLIKKVIESESFKTHPLYQLRIFQMLTNAFDRLDKMLELSQKDKITTIDGKSLTKNIILNIKDDILNMIGSFESVFVFKNKNMNTDDIILKFTKIIKLVEGDMKKCFKLWPEISRILQEYNYCKLNKYNIE
ncbi:MAG: M48 family metalloprotease [Terrisporobacter sp.]